MKKYFSKNSYLPIDIVGFQVYDTSNEFESLTGKEQDRIIFLHSNSPKQLQYK
jgi:hypothetical protein